MSDGYRVHFSIDCTGNTIATENAWKGTRKGGTVEAFNPNKTLNLLAGEFHRLGKVLNGSFYGDTQPFRDFPVIARLYLDGEVNLDNLILNRIQLNDIINEAFEAFHNDCCINVGRTVIEFPLENNFDNKRIIEFVTVENSFKRTDDTKLVEAYIEKQIVILTICFFNFNNNILILKLL